MHHLTARLTADAKVKTFDSGRSVVNFNVATNEYYKTKTGEKRKETQFYECSYWVTTKVAQYLTKGKLIELIGSITTRAYQDKDGKPRAALQLRTSKIIFHSKGEESKDASGNTNDADGTGSKAGKENDDLPF